MIFNDAQSTAQLIAKAAALSKQADEATKGGRLIDASILKAQATVAWSAANAAIAADAAAKGVTVPVVPSTVLNPPAATTTAAMIPGVENTTLLWVAGLGAAGYLAWRYMSKRA
jgi:hypothetical protein